MYHVLRLIDQIYSMWNMFLQSLTLLLANKDVLHQSLRHIIPVIPDCLLDAVTAEFLK